MNSVGDKKREGKIYIKFIYIYIYIYIYPIKNAITRYANPFVRNRIRYSEDIRIRKKNMPKVVKLDKLDV